MQKTIELTDVALEVLEGLKAHEKHISSKFFYDAEGSRIFQHIMEMPEYYPARCEAEIFRTHKRAIGSLFCTECSSIDLVELGAGDGHKTRILIDDLLRQDVQFRYIPVDISEEAVLHLAGAMNQEFPELRMVARVGDYDYPQTISFLSQISGALSGDDLFFIGLDLKKDPRVIRKAYDDPHGITRDFNLNLLRRMNRELGADFDPEQFLHAPAYDPGSGTATSHPVSLSDQEVHFSEFKVIIPFREGESIFTEMSQKYDMEMIHDMAETSGFSVIENFFDSRQCVVNSLWKKK